MISGKILEYKLLWIANVRRLAGLGTFLTKKWADKVTDLSRENDKMIVLRHWLKRLLFQ